MVLVGKSVTNFSDLSISHSQNCSRYGVVVLASCCITAWEDQMHSLLAPDFISIPTVRKAPQSITTGNALSMPYNPTSSHERYTQLEVFVLEYTIEPKSLSVNSLRHLK